MKRHGILASLLALGLALSACGDDSSPAAAISLSEPEYVAAFCAASGSFQRVIDDNLKNPQGLLAALPDALESWRTQLEPLQPPADFAPIHEMFLSMLRTAEAQPAPTATVDSTEEALGAYLGPPPPNSWDSRQSNRMSRRASIPLPARRTAAPKCHPSSPGAKHSALRTSEL